MATLYKRNINLTVQDLETRDQYKFDGLRIAFDFVKSYEGIPNSGTITIYNVSKDARAPLDKVGNVLVLRGGYGNENKQLLTGSILKSETTDEGVDIVTSLEIGDGAIALASAHVSQVFPKGNTELNILEAAVASLKDEGISLASNFDTTPFETKLPRAVSVSEDAKSVLTEYTQKRGYTWSVQDSQLQILKLDKGTTEPAIKLGPQTGLIGTPVTSFSNISFKTLLISELAVGRKVVIDLPTVTGNFVVLKLNGRGDNYGGEFGFTCEGLVL
jgi:hypothetical protein